MSDSLPIPQSERFAISTAAPGQADFGIPFPFQRSSDVVVLREIDGVAELLMLGEHYVIVGENEPAGGTLSLNEGNEAEGTERFIIYGDAELARLMNTTLGGKFSSRQIELDLDRLTIIAQEHARDLRRAYMVPLGQTGGVVHPGTAGQLVQFGADGNLVPGPDFGDFGDAAEAAAAAAAAAIAAVAAKNTAVAAAGTAAADAVSAGNAAIAATEAADDAGLDAASALSDRILAQAAKVASEAAKAIAEAAASSASADAGDAETARLAAVAAQGVVEALVDVFGDSWLGAHAAAPTTDTDGSPLEEGDLFWNATTKQFGAYDLTGTAWVYLASGGAASLITFTPVGGLSATTVQAALAELDAEKFNKSDVDTDGTLAANSDSRVASQKAAKTYIDGRFTALLGGVSSAFDTLAEIATAIGTITANGWVTAARITDATITYAKLAAAALATISEYRAGTASKIIAPDVAQAAAGWAAGPADASTMTFNHNDGTRQTATATVARTISASNLKDGMPLIIVFTGNYAHSYSTTYFDFTEVGGVPSTVWAIYKVAGTVRNGKVRVYSVVETVA